MARQKVTPQVELQLPWDSSQPAGLVSVPRYRVALVREAAAACPPSLIRDAASAAAALRPCFDSLDREQFLVAGLDAKHRLIGVNIASLGSLTVSIVHPREVFKPLILMNAAAFLCAHNHPSGDPTPSPEDRALTKRLREAGELLGIPLLEHLIVGEERVYSFAAHGWPAA